MAKMKAQKTTATTPKMTKTKKTTSNEQVKLVIPSLVTETEEFELVRESVVSSLLPTGTDFMYGLRNKLTGMIELRGHSLALSIVIMQNQQQMYDKVRTGEFNGYSSVEGKTVVDGMTGLL